MDYYEELGLDRTATEEDIKRAHRRLAKLLHPDGQTDDDVKHIAEAQMRRLNGIIDILSKPERRREYDEQLIASVPGFSFLKFRKRVVHSWPWWVGSTVGAVVLTVGAVSFFANRWGSSFAEHTPTYIASGAEASSESEPNPTVSSSAPTASVVSSVVSDSRNPDKPVGAGANERTKPTPSPKTTVVVSDVPRHKSFHLPLSSVSAKPVSVGVSLPPAPNISASNALRAIPASLPPDALPDVPKLPDAVATTTRSRDALEGEWVYAPTEPEKRTAGFYPPEFIDLKIWNESGLRGEYHARYHVVDRPIPPEVNFQLAPEGTPRHFTWVSSNGSKGTLQVRAMEPDSIRIEWRTTVFSHEPALTAGTATLVRRAPQSN